MKKKITLRILCVLLLLGASTSVFGIRPVQAETGLASVYVEPIVSSALPGAHFTVDIMIRDVERLYSWQVNMTFDPNALQFVSVTEGEFLGSQPEGTWSVPPYVDNVEGFVLWGVATQGSHLGVNGSGRLATMEFSVADSGVSLLHMTNGTKLLEWRPSPPPGETTLKVIPHDREDGFFTTEVAELFELNDELSADYTALVTSYSSLQSQVSSLQSQVSSLQSQVSTLTSDKNSLQSQINSSNQSNTTLTYLAVSAAIAAIVLACTTIYFATRKPKLKGT